jgi:hypothetical protein
MVLESSRVWVLQGASAPTATQNTMLQRYASVRLGTDVLKIPGATADQRSNLADLFVNGQNFHQPGYDSEMR